MKDLSEFYTMKVGVVDLAASTVNVVPVEERVVRERIGGAAMNLCLFDQHEEGDPIVLGVGPLTGSFVPASSLAMATFRSPLTERMSFVPLMLRSGPEMKFAGFDFIILKGRATKQVFLRIRGGKIDLHHAEYGEGLEIPEMTAFIRKKWGVGQASVIAGPAADRGEHHAIVSCGMWGSLDKTGLARTMASKNVKGVVFEGASGLRFGQSNLERSQRMIVELGLHGHLKANCFISVLDRMGSGNDVKKIAGKFHGKQMACYRCPFPCMSYMEFYGDDRRRRRMGKETTGVAICDHRGFAALGEKHKTKALPLMAACLRFGIDPVYVASNLPDSETLEELISGVETLALQPEESIQEDVNDVPVGIAPSLYHLFGGGLPPISADDSWGRRVGFSMIVGICPLFFLFYSNISVRTMLSFLSEDDGYVDALEETVARAVQSVLDRQ